MELEKIISITGKPGLYKIVSQIKNGLIVESVLDKKRMPVYASDKVSAISDISIYTYSDDIPLIEVFEKMIEKTQGKPAINHQSSLDDLRSFLQEVVEDFDQDRVYHSDLKKLFQWFNLLVENNLLEVKKEKDPNKKSKKAVKKEEEAVEKKDTTQKK